MKNLKKSLLIALALAFTLTLILGIAAACKPDHVCTHKCSDCNLCTSACQDPACADKCTCSTGGGGGTEYEKDMDISENSGTFDDYSPEMGAGQRQVVIYWREAEHSYDDNDVWLWEKDGAEGRAFEFHPCKYGAKAVINVSAATQEVGYIIRANTTEHGTSWGGDDVQKVVSDDRFITLVGDVTEVYLTGANKYLFTSSDGGKTLQIMKVVTRMTIESLTQIRYGLVPNLPTLDKSQVTVKCDGAPVEIAQVKAIDKTITLSSPIDLSKNYEVTVQGYDAKVALPLGVFDSKGFGDKYNYDGNDLGAIVTDGSVVFKLWAPTASKVVLNLYQQGNDGPAPRKVDMTLGEKGVWSYTESDKNNAVGKYYTYSVTTSAGTQEAVDPYAKSAGLNGDRGMVIDLNDTNPANFTNSAYVNLDSYTDAVIWETHVRDFSNNIASSQYKGKYLAFTETGLTNSAGIPVGVDYVKNLGITHIHLMPVFDFASIDESSDAPQFNWGYDPKNYNVPEGSYATDATRGEVRVREFKQMVQALHAQNLGVVMDVVYNHTYDKNSNLNKVVPNYYYRYNPDGSNSAGSGCGNDTASERYMFSKYMVDSVTYWVKEYKLDGLRFDLMGLHDLDTMQAIEKAVHAINPDAIIYGEGWTMTTAAKAGTILATQANIKRVTASQGAAGAISVFNDIIRDGLRGSVFDAAEKGFLADSSKNSNKVAIALGGTEQSNSAGWTATNGATINYISAHDNNTLWDKLAISAPDASKEQRLAMNRMGAAIVMLSKGTPFMTAGEEMLRTKPNGDGTFDSNSYNSSDAINNLKWETLTANSDEYKMMQFYKGLIEMRRNSDVLTADKDVSITVTGSNVITAIYDGGSKGKVVAYVNNSAEASAQELPQGNWSLKCNGVHAGNTEITAASGSVSVPANTVYVYFSK